MHSLYAAIVACALNLMIVSIIIRLSRTRIGDSPPTGGVAIFYAAFPVALFFSSAGFSPPGRILAYLPAIACMAAVHAIFSYVKTSGRFHLVVSVVIAVILCYFDFRFRSVWIPGVGESVLPAWASWALTVAWILIAMKSIELAGRIPGFCACAGLAAACACGFLSLFAGEPVPAIFAFSIAGSLLGFLFNNGPPERISLGESGKAQVGFMAALLPLLGDRSTGGGIRPFAAVATLLVPIVFASVTAFARYAAAHPVTGLPGSTRGRPLGDRVWGSRRASLIMYMACFASGIVSVSSAFLGKPAFLAVILAWSLVAAALIIAREHGGIKLPSAPD
jgi:UDP-N-acetylmuramyl pentapeptide phosphotransferase/UDP-N-acetylglucosamine-1-phosphate transferase